MDCQLQLLRLCFFTSQINYQIWRCHSPPFYCHWAKFRCCHGCHSCAVGVLCSSDCNLCRMGFLLCTYFYVCCNSPYLLYERGKDLANTEQSVICTWQCEDKFKSLVYACMQSPCTILLNHTLHVQPLSSGCKSFDMSCYATNSLLYVV